MALGLRLQANGDGMDSAPQEIDSTKVPVGELRSGQADEIQNRLGYASTESRWIASPNCLNSRPPLAVALRTQWCYVASKLVTEIRSPPEYNRFWH